MAYDRYDTRQAPQDERSRWRQRDEGRDRGSSSNDDRGFFQRAGDEVASWFGDEDAERRRREDHMRDQREGGWSGRDQSRSQGYGDRSRDRDYDRGYGRDYDRDHNGNRGRSEQDQRSWYETRGLNGRGGWSERDYNPDWQSELERGRGSGRERAWDRNRDRERNGDLDHNRDRDRNRNYRPMAGDYGREGRPDYESDQFFAASGYGRNDYGRGDFGRNDQGRGRDRDRSQSPWGRDEYRRTSRAGTADKSDRSRHEEPHYESWRQRHMNELDRDYDDYRRENQSRFEDEFGSWRERRQQKRGLMSQVHDHMEVVGNDDKHVGTVDKVAGDRIILTKSDPDSGGVHHSLSCSEIDHVEGERVVLDCSADEAKKKWRDESRNRALFERDDQGQSGPHVLNRSFEGTYR